MSLNLNKVPKTMAFLPIGLEERPKLRNRGLEVRALPGAFHYFCPYRIAGESFRYPLRDVAVLRLWSQWG